MKHVTRLSNRHFDSYLGVGFASTRVMAQDVVQVATQLYKALLENERVRVVGYQSNLGRKWR